MEYTELSATEQKQILAQRVKQYEAEHFNHATNKELLVASGASDEQTKAAIKVAEDAMKTLDDAHAETTKKLATIDPASP